MENRPEHLAENGRTVEGILQSMTQDLKHLHQGLISQLSQEVNQLQAEKSRLTAEVKQLRDQHHSLQTQSQIQTQSDQMQGLSQQQMAQQQLWAKQLALALSNHLQGLMVQQINQIARMNQGAAESGSNLATSSAHSDHAHRLLASLDETFSTTFQTLQQELNSYESSLSQQLGRMHGMEQQGEVMLQALVSLLRKELQVEASRQLPTPPPPQENGYPSQPGISHAPARTGENQSLGLVSPAVSENLSGLNPSGLQMAQGYHSFAQDQTSGYEAGAQSFSPSYPNQERSHPQPVSPMPLAAPGISGPPQAAVAKRDTNFWLGLCLVLLSTVALSIHNVVVRVIGKPSSILGLPEIGGFINITVLGNSLLILWLRMLVVLPLMIGLAIVLYPPIWRDLKRFFTAPDRRPVMVVVGSGFFLFLSQVFIYIAIGQIGPGPAVTILFMYPIVTVPLSWFLFGARERPTPLRWAVMATILMGVFLTALPNITSTSKGLSWGGVTIAIGSGIAFALYLILMQLGFKKLHPVPVSLVQFFTIFLLSSVILIVLGPSLGVLVEPGKRGGFILSGIILGMLTLVGYLSNNFGVRYMGAGLASIIASIGPVMTAILAWILIGNKLGSIQWFGILLVTLSVGALSFERMKLQPRVKKAI